MVRGNYLLPSLSVLSFSALTLAFVFLWAARAPAIPDRAPYWTWPFALALAAALAGGIVDVRGVIVCLAYAAACRAASRAARPLTRGAAHAAMLGLCGALMLHVLPGFHNPIVISQVVLSPGGVPYTKYLNFDKAVAGLFLLGLYAPELIGRNGPAKAGLHVRNAGLSVQSIVGAGFSRPVRAFAWRFALLLVVVIAMSVAVDFVRWDPKMPRWFPLWAWSILLFTAVPEEALFRGVVQASVERWLGHTHSATIAAIVAGATVFGLAHARGGATYVLLAMVAGAGYGWIFAATRSLAAAVLAHFGLNAIHFLFFTYPALALHV
jgi:uncharacterized protein